MKQAIGIFDSGLGGLTVVAAVRKHLPQERIIYLGDTARVPYGNRSPETITRFAVEDTSFLLRHGVKAIVAACNTVSATAVAELRGRFPQIPILGVIEPGAEAAIRSGAKRIIVLGTRATIRSGAYTCALLAGDQTLHIEPRPCPLFVPIVEEGILDGPLTQEVFELYLHDLRKDPPDAILLGCTHYPLLKNALRKYIGPRTQIIDSAETAAVALETELRKDQLNAPETENGSLELFVTDIASGFLEQASRFLNADVPEPGIAKLD